ncbi:MAG: prephenate dehydrogenase/arogenate dehydrogenase family protein [Anaerolineae bacterium]|nr:prephenate dehydrogenase/arogenate dehydrogenase family protein [Anaerolineae bacterium]MCB9104516.1 prephenate dehydrogenase/arogenate dehydrogenase family protein [Anaerolineales bacterium]
MSTFTITIVGAGVIGTSLGLALKQKSDSLRLVAHDKDLEHAKAAVKMGAFHKAEWNLINACDQADLIILAMPLSGIRFTLEAIAGDLKQNVVISDTTTSKTTVLAWADELLPKHAHYVGGHPLVHPAGTGYQNARADLFRGKLYCLTPSSSANEQAVQLMADIVTLLDANPFFLDPAEHDGLTSATEHLPTLLSIALIRTLAQQKSWREQRKLAGQLFEQVTAGASGDPDSLRDGFLDNSLALSRWLEVLIAHLQQLQTLIAAGHESDEALAQLIDQAVVERTNWLIDVEKGQFSDPELASPKVENPGFLQQMIGFGAFRRRGSEPPKK